MTADRNPVYWTCTVKFSPEEAGVDVDVTTFRARAQKVLAAEGMHVGPWQCVPLPGQDVFQRKKGYGHGCPWTCCHKGDVEYRAEDYPKTLAFLASHARVSGMYPLNTMELVKRYADGVRRVMGQASQWAHRSDLD